MVDAQRARLRRATRGIAVVSIAAMLVVTALAAPATCWLRSSSPR